MSVQQQTEIWKQQASRWAHVGPPTRPSESDGQLMLEMALRGRQQNSDTATTIVLGVTPEVVQLAWPPGSRLHAFDLSADMINRVWQPNPHLPCHAWQSRWQSLPLQSCSADSVVGDGCLTALQSMTECSDVLAEVARVLKPDGRLVIRCFIRPRQSENLASIVADVAHNRIRHFGTLKWRLAMALCDPDSATVAPTRIHTTFNELYPDRQALHLASGWPSDTIDTIDSYADMGGFFTFMTLPQLQEVCGRFFTIETMEHGNYELAERCPTIALSKRH